MSTLTFTSAAVLSAAALAAGLLIGWVHHRLRTDSGFVTLARHGEEIQALRRRYRRRLRAMRDAMLRHRLNEEQLQARLNATEFRHSTETSLLADAQTEIAALRQRLGELEARHQCQSKLISEFTQREGSIRAELGRALERVDAFERDHGLLRIERDELLARTQRLRTLPVPDAGEATERPPQATEVPVADTTASRAELADRDARIHELECQVRESESRMTEIRSDLHTWKYRIAPLALHMKIQREKARRTAETPPAVDGDDLRQIRGIGRGLQKKLRAEGITEIAQLAGMSPAELAGLAVRVGLAASRPERDRWAEQARAHCANASAPRSGAA